MSTIWYSAILVDNEISISGIELIDPPSTLQGEYLATTPRIAVERLLRRRMDEVKILKVRLAETQRKTIPIIAWLEDHK